MPNGIAERTVGAITVLEISGRLTVGTLSSELDEKLQGLVTAGQMALLLDCSQVTAIDTQGIHALIRAYASVQKRGGKLKLLKPSARVRNVLTVTRLLTVLEAFDDEETAVRSFASA